MAFLLTTFGREVGVYETHVAAIEGARAFVDQMTSALEADGIRMAMPMWRHVEWAYDQQTGGSFTTDVLAVRRSFARVGRDPGKVHAMFDITPL